MGIVGSLERVSQKELTEYLSDSSLQRILSHGIRKSRSGFDLSHLRKELLPGS